MRSSCREVVHKKLGRNKNGRGGLRSIEVVAVSQMLRVVRENPDGLSQTVSPGDPQRVPPKRPDPVGLSWSMSCIVWSTDVGE
jgi:hypothetical protein